MRRARRLVRALCLATTVGLLAACGTQSGASSAHTLGITLESDPPQFNMGLTTDGSSVYVARSIFEPLVNLTKDFKISPGLADKWSANKDATEFTFKLHPGVKWHDGKPFTSADVKYYFDKVIPIHPLAADMAKIYDRTDTPDETTAIVKLKKPYGPFFQAVTAHYMIPAHLYDGTDIETNPANLNPVGTGPFTFESFNRGDTVIVNKNKDYWGPQGDVDRIVYKVMPDGNARTSAFQAGEINVGLKLPIITMMKMQDDPKYAFHPAVMPEHLYLFYNTKNDILKDYPVRRAIYQAINRDQIADKVYHGTADPSRSLMPNQVDWAIDKSTDYTKEFKFDPDAANKMLDDAGYKRKSDGTRFTIRLNYRNSNPTWSGTAELIKGNLAKLGIKVNLQMQDTNVYGDNTYTKHDFDISLLQLGAYADPSLGVARAYVCNPKDVQFLNPSGVCDTQLDQAFTAAAGTGDQAERVKYLTEAADRNAQILGTAPLLSIKSMESFRADQWQGTEQFDGLENWDFSKLKANG